MAAEVCITGSRARSRASLNCEVVGFLIKGLVFGCTLGVWRSSFRISRLGVFNGTTD